MEKSIQEFQENGIPALEKIVLDFYKDPSNIAGFVSGIQKNVLQLGLDIIREQFESIDERIKTSEKRKKTWAVVKSDPKTLVTSIGEFTYERTLFQNKKTGEYSYLADRVLDIGKHERMTEDAEAKMLEEAVQTSYRKAGKESSLMSEVSKQTVMNKLHVLRFPEYEHKGKKKVVENLYIDADEDHIALQQADETESEEEKKSSVLGKLVYVYEGIEPEAPKSKRYRLIEPYYFSGVYESKDNAKLWDEVWEYIDSKYEIDKVKHIYLNSDGAKWITGGSRKIHGIIRVIDEYHLSKYLTSMTSHLWDSTEDAKDRLREAIRGGPKEEFESWCELIIDDAEEEKAKERVEKGREYILNNWTAAKTRLRRRSGVVGSSTEGHVSHVLASRMSSRPMGWSKIGASQMAKLRAYYWNNGNMLDLVRYQKQALPKAAGAERLFSTTELEKWENKLSQNPNRYEERLNVTPAFQAMKQLSIIENIWN